MLTAKQSTYLQTGLENGFNVENQIHLQKQRNIHFNCSPMGSATAN
jgi:hypothetical protein